MGIWLDSEGVDKLIKEKKKKIKEKKEKEKRKKRDKDYVPPRSRKEEVFMSLLDSSEIKLSLVYKEDKDEIIFGKLKLAEIKIKVWRIEKTIFLKGKNNIKKSSKKKTSKLEEIKNKIYKTFQKYGKKDWVGLLEDSVKGG